MIGFDVVKEIIKYIFCEDNDIVLLLGVIGLFWSDVLVVVVNLFCVFDIF